MPALVDRSASVIPRTCRMARRAGPWMGVVTMGGNCAPFKLCKIDDTHRRHRSQLGLRIPFRLGEMGAETGRDRLMTAV